MSDGRPNFQHSMPLHPLKAKEFIALSVQVCHDFGWKLHYTSETGLIAFTQEGVTKWNAEIWIVIEKDKVEITSTSLQRDLHDADRNQKLVEQLVKRIKQRIQHTDAETLHSLAAQVQDKVVHTEAQLRKQPVPSLKQQVLEFLLLFIPQRNLFITPILLDSNILIFCLMLLSGVHPIEPSGESLLQWGASYKPYILEGEWWRLLTCCFIHIGIVHVLMNMYALLYIGVLLEPIIGKSRFLFAYIFTGIVGSATSFWWHDHGISAGASGAIFGMYGVFLALLSGKLIEKYTRKSLLASILIFVLFNLMNGLKGGVDNAAHIGGLLSGLLIGFVFLMRLKGRSS